jgi:hypothetical protein
LAQAVKEAPADPSACSLRAVALLSLGQTEEAVATLRHAVRLEPTFAPAHYNLGVALLLKGSLRQGWREYEARAANELFLARRGDVGRPVWTGRPLRGKRILIQAEQGLGDAIQFIRYVPLVAARQGQVIVECLPALRRVFEPMRGVSALVTTNDPLPEFDVRVPLLSLPRMFRTTLDTVPAEVPYLTAGARRTAAWRRRLAGYSGLKVAFTERGSPANPHDARRSLPLAMFKELLDVPGVHWFLLQKREPGAAPPALPSKLDVTDLEPLLTDFADTGAAIECMDLTISVDTALAHLAGALGRPVWLLLPFVPDWRWLLERSDSPWYPTARLFRQRQRGDWGSVLREVRIALEALVRGSAA